MSYLEKTPLEEGYEHCPQCQGERYEYFEPDYSSGELEAGAWSVVCTICHGLGLLPKHCFEEDEAIADA